MVTFEAVTVNPASCRMLVVEPADLGRSSGRSRVQTKPRLSSSFPMRVSVT